MLFMKIVSVIYVIALTTIFSVSESPGNVHERKWYLFFCHSVTAFHKQTARVVFKKRFHQVSSSNVGHKCCLTSVSLQKKTVT